MLKKALTESHTALGTNVFLNVNHHFPSPSPFLEMGMQAGQNTSPTSLPLLFCLRRLMQNPTAVRLPCLQLPWSHGQLPQSLARQAGGRRPHKTQQFPCLAVLQDLPAPCPLTATTLMKWRGCSKDGAGSPRALLSCVLGDGAEVLLRESDRDPHPCVPFFRKFVGFIYLFIL